MFIWTHINVFNLILSCNFIVWRIWIIWKITWLIVFVLIPMQLIVFTSKNFHWWLSLHLLLSIHCKHRLLLISIGIWLINIISLSIIVIASTLWCIDLLHRIKLSILTYQFWIDLLLWHKYSCLNATFILVNFKHVSFLYFFLELSKFFVWKNICSWTLIHLLSKCI